MRPKLSESGLSIGKRTRLHRLLYGAGPGNGTLLLLPIDQGLEHGPRDFFPNPAAKDPMYEVRLGIEGRFSGIALHIGLAQQYMHHGAGRLPLVLKLNGKTEIPSDAQAISPQVASVEDAVRLGADAVGYTLYVGSPSQAEDFRQFMSIRQEADRYGMPVIVWSYPRGEAIEAKGGKDSFYAIDYAARVAAELGADVIKLNVPRLDREKAALTPRPYRDLDITLDDALRQVVASAGQAFVIFAGGEKGNEQATLEKARQCMEAGGTGLIFGRNVWQRPFEEGLQLSHQIHAILQEFGDR